MMNITATTRKTKVQGLDCYMPALRVKDSDYSSIFVSRGDPLVSRVDALKYSNIWRNESIRAGFITDF